MNRLHCNLCGAEYYVNPPVMKQKKTRCPGCHVVQPLENYDRFYHVIHFPNEAEDGG